MQDTNTTPQGQEVRTTKKLVLGFPDKDAPGYLHLLKTLPEMQRTAGDLQATLTSGALLTPAQVDKLVDLLLAFVVEPADKAKACELIFEASAERLSQMMRELIGRLQGV